MCSIMPYSNYVMQYTRYYVPIHVALYAYVLGALHPYQLV